MNNESKIRLKLADAISNGQIDLIGDKPIASPTDDINHIIKVLRETFDENILDPEDIMDHDHSMN